MAILSKIREKTFVLILVIGLALFAFVIGDAINKDGSSTRVDVVGEVNGEEISREEFSQQLEAFKTQSNNRNASDLQIMNSVWESLVRELVFKDQLEAAGIVVGEDDVWQNILGVPYFQNDPSFKNEIGIFDEEKVKEFIANLREDAIGAADNSPEKLTWLNWLRTEHGLRRGLIRNSYSSLVDAGLGASLEEGKRDYLFNNTNINAQFVYVPYSSVADSLISITNKDYQDYINENSKQFEVEKSRNIKFVQFNIVASDEDKNSMNEELLGLSPKFKLTENNGEFIEEEGSDLSADDKILYRSNLPSSMADSIMNAKVGDVVGPYEEGGYFKLSKIEEFIQLPDSVSASHILISYLGSQSAGPDTKQTETEARITADSLLTVLKRNGSKFDAMAKEFSIDKSNSETGGDLDWFGYVKMVPEFRDYTFLNKKGDIGIVQTPFGFHIVKITGQKNIQKTVQLSTFARKIGPSEATETQFYQDAEIFASKLVEGADFDALALENTYVPQPANNLKELDENVPGIRGNNRQIVRWAFDEDLSYSDVKRFDVDNGFVVAMLVSKTEKGIAAINDVASQIKPILINKKKAAIISKNLNGVTLEEIANSNSVNVRTASNVNLASPTLSGVGSEPDIVAAMSTAPEGEIIKGLEGEKGVFVISVTSRELPTELENYETFRNRLETKYKGRSAQLYDALKEVSDIEDYRANIY